MVGGGPVALGQGRGAARGGGGVTRGRARGRARAARARGSREDLARAPFVRGERPRGRLVGGGGGDPRGQSRRWRRRRSPGVCSCSRSTIRRPRARTAPGRLRRGGVTVAVSTDGRAPALAGLLREGLEAVLPDDLEGWTAEAERQRAAWRDAGVPMAERRPLLLEALNGSMTTAAQALRSAVSDPTVNEPARPTVGHVSLVGAGPGERRSAHRARARRLAEADLVLYDALASEELRVSRRTRAVLRRQARRPAVDRSGRLNRLLDQVRAARPARRAPQVRRPVRVRPRRRRGAGARRAPASPFEVVPGVSSAIAAPALAGIPVTHRGLAVGLRRRVRPRRGGVRAAPRRPRARLADARRADGRCARAARSPRGWSRAAGRPTTPAAIVVGAATPQSWRWLGTLGDAGRRESGRLRRRARDARHRRASVWRSRLELGRSQSSCRARRESRNRPGGTSMSANPVV